MQTIKVEKLVSEEAGTVKGSSNSYDLVKLDHCLCGASFLIVSADCTNLYSRRFLGREFLVLHSIYCGALLGLGTGRGWGRDYGREGRCVVAT